MVVAHLGVQLQLASGINGPRSCYEVDTNRQDNKKDAVTRASLALLIVSHTEGTTGVEPLAMLVAPPCGVPAPHLGQWHKLLSQPPWATASHLPSWYVLVCRMPRMVVGNTALAILASCSAAREARDPQATRRYALDGKPICRMRALTRCHGVHCWLSFPRDIWWPTQYGDG